MHLKPRISHSKKRLPRDGLIKSLREFCAIYILILLCIFKVNIVGQRKSPEIDQTPALVGQGLFIQVIEMKNTIGNLYNKIRFKRYVAAFDISRAKIDHGIRYFRFDVVQPVVFCQV
jgi:hypothetical protein